MQVKYAFASVAGLAWLSACASSPPLQKYVADDGTACVADRDALMHLDFWTFDQDPERGIRKVLDKQGCDLAAADLMADYHARLIEKGERVAYKFPDQEVVFSETGEVGMLYWHEGQVRAFAGQTDRAVELFRKSIAADLYDNAAKKHYALATIAFLQHDKDALLAERGALAGIAPENDLNLGVVDGLVACFGKSYDVAYGSPECDRRPGRAPAP